MLLIFVMSGYEELVRVATKIAGNRLDPVMTDVPDIVDVVVRTPLGTSDHCFVSCVLSVEQSVPEYIVRSTVFFKHSIITTEAVSAMQAGVLHGAPC